LVNKKKGNIILKYSLFLNKRVIFAALNLFNIMESLIERITINADICHGKATVRNMRYPVDMLLDLLSSGMTWGEIINDYPVLEEDDIRACLLFASQLAKVKTLSKLIA
jgi:uncharacterized protein (DUF433 family)